MNCNLLSNYSCITTAKKLTNLESANPSDLCQQWAHADRLESASPHAHGCSARGSQQKPTWQRFPVPKMTKLPTITDGLKYFESTLEPPGSLSAWQVLPAAWISL